MQIVALDGTKLIVLMLAGGVFALAGLWLMFRPQPGGEAARIELFGLKLQASSAGLLVFLIGAAFLALPIFVPEKPPPVHPAASAPASSAPSTQTTPPSEARNAPSDALVATEVRTNVAVRGAEIEPNDAFASANSLELGTSVTGSVSDQDMDAFVVAIPPDTRGQIAASVVATKGDVTLTLFDNGGQVVGSSPTYRDLNRAASVTGKTESSRYFAVVGNRGDEESRYYLTVGTSPD